MISETMMGLIEDLKECANAAERFQFFIDLSDELEDFPEEYKTPDYMVMGCASNAWVKAEEKEGKVYISGQADAIISKGFLAFFIIGLSGTTKNDILEFTVNDLSEHGIIESLSPSRSNGALASLNKIHALVGAL